MYSFLMDEFWHCELESEQACCKVSLHVQNLFSVFALTWLVSIGTVESDHLCHKVSLHN